MRARTALTSLVCATALLIAGCSAGIAGTPQLAGAGGGSVGAGASPSSGGVAPGSDSGDGSGSGDGGETGLPPASGGVPGIPPGLATAIPTDLGVIPGVNGECLAVAGIVLSVSVLFLAPMTGQPLTKDQVDQAFAQMGDVPAQLKQPVQVLHDAAVQAIGKSAEQAQAILQSDKVSKAMDTVSNYADSKCGSS